MPTGYMFSHRIDVRFRDCDPRTHVNNAVYHTYLEESRLALWRHLFGTGGMPGVGTILARTEIDFLAPAFAHETLDVRVSIAGLGRSSITMTYTIVNAKTDQTLVRAKAVIVTFDYAANKATPIPAEARDVLARLQS
jgi:acyl-CoA thioester hydrolase